MNRLELALKIMDIIEESCPGLVHTHDLEFEDYVYDSEDLELLAQKIAKACTPWSQRKAMDGEYDKPFDATELERLLAEMRSPEGRA